MLQLARPDDRERIEVLAQQIHGLHVQMRPDVYELTPEMWTQERYDEAVAQTGHLLPVADARHWTASRDDISEMIE